MKCSLMIIISIAGLCFRTHALILDDKLTTNEECPLLEEQLVNCQKRNSDIEEEIRLLKVASRCRNGWTHGNGSCYYMPYQQKSWNDARAECQQLGAHLAVIGSAEEEVIIADIIKRAHNIKSGYEGVTYVWLGGFDTAKEGHWHWVTGEPFNYTNWRAGNPNNGHHGSADEDCLDWSSGWNDNDCSARFFFLCEMSRKNKNSYIQT